MQVGAHPGRLPWQTWRVNVPARGIPGSSVVAGMSAAPAGLPPAGQGGCAGAGGGGGGGGGGAEHG